MLLVGLASGDGLEAGGLSTVREDGNLRGAGGLPLRELLRGARLQP